MNIKMRSERSLAAFIPAGCCQNTAGACLGEPFPAVDSQSGEPTGFGGESCAKDENDLCGVLTHGSRCAFFERSVLPLAQARGLTEVTLQYPPEPKTSAKTDKRNARRRRRSDYTASQGHR